MTMISPLALAGLRRQIPAQRTGHHDSSLGEHEVAVAESEAYLEAELRRGLEKMRAEQDAYLERKHRRKAEAHGIDWRDYARMKLISPTELMLAHLRHRERMRDEPDAAELARREVCTRPDKLAYKPCDTGQRAAEHHFADLRRNLGAPDLDIYLCGQDPQTGEITEAGCGWLHVGNNPIKRRTRKFEQQLRKIR